MAQLLLIKWNVGVTYTLDLHCVYHNVLHCNFKTVDYSLSNMGSTLTHTPVSSASLLITVLMPPDTFFGSSPVLWSRFNWQQPLSPPICGVQHHHDLALWNSNSVGAQPRAPSWEGQGSGMRSLTLMLSKWEMSSWKLMAEVHYSFSFPVDHAHVEWRA